MSEMTILEWGPAHDEPEPFEPWADGGEMPDDH